MSSGNARVSPGSLVLGGSSSENRKSTRARRQAAVSMAQILYLDQLLRKPA